MLCGLLDGFGFPNAWFSMDEHAKQRWVLSNQCCVQLCSAYIIRGGPLCSHLVVHPGASWQGDCYDRLVWPAALEQHDLVTEKHKGS